jgi:hypothetical protein
MVIIIINVTPERVSASQQHTEHPQEMGTFSLSVININLSQPTKKTAMGAGKGHIIHVSWVMVTGNIQYWHKNNLTHTA